MMAALPEWNGAVQPVQRDFQPVQNVILPLDGTPETRAAIPVAQMLRGLYNATLHVINVGATVVARSDLTSGEYRAPASARDAHRTAEEDAGVTLRKPPRSTRFVQGSGDPVEVIARSLQKLPNSILVVSTELGAHSGHDRFGGITESLFTKQPERTVVVGPDRGEAPWSLRHILLAHDGTPGARAATEPAIDLALRSKADVVALHVAARGQERPEETGSMSAPLYVDQPQHEWPAWAHEFMNRILASGAPASSIHFKLTVTGGQPGSEVAQVARDRNVDLVVMAWHGHWEHENCASRVVIRRCGCPVLLAYSAS